MDPTPTPSTPPTEPNPLMAALDIPATPSPGAATGLDFLDTAMAMLDAGPQIPDPVADPAPAADAPGDPLASIDDAFPDLDSKATPQARERWDELKRELKAERRAAYELRRESEELKSKTLYDPEEVETLKKKVADYDKELAVHRIEATQEYKTSIDEPLRAIGESAASIARRYEIDQDALFNALAEPDEGKQQRALTDLVDGMNDRDRLKLYQMADDTLLVLRKRDDLKARSHEALQELDLRQKHTQEREIAERKRTFSGHVEKVFESLEDKMPFHPLDPHETKSAVLEKLKRDTLATDLGAVGPDVQAYSAAAGVVLPRMVHQLRALAVENAALKSRLSGVTAASPARSRALPTAAAPAAVTGGFLDNLFAQLPT